MPATYVKDTTTGQTYKLGTGGYYQKYTDAVPTGETPVSAAGIGGYYSDVAKAETDPYYNQQTTTSTENMEAAKASTADRLKAMYTDTGMGLSSFSDSAQAANEISSKRDLAARLADIEKARTGEYTAKLGQYTATQRAGDTADEERRLAAEAAAAAAAERERQYAEAQKERDAAQAARDAQQRLAEIELQKAQVKSSGSTASEKKASVYLDLEADIKDNLSQWNSSGKPAFWTENVLIPELEANYIKQGMTSANIRKLVYSIRKNAAYGGE